MLKHFPHYKQPDSKDCGPTCLKIVAKHYGKTISLQHIRTLSETTRAGSSLLGLSEAAEKMGFRTLGVKLSLKDLQEAPLPCILHWNKNHYVVLSPLTPKGGIFNRLIKSSPLWGERGGLIISDPAHGLLQYTQEEFLKSWIGNNADENTEKSYRLISLKTLTNSFTASLSVIKTTIPFIELSLLSVTFWFTSILEDLHLKSSPIDTPNISAS